MTQSNGPAGGNTISEALNQTINHIAGAHGLIDKVRESARAGGEPDAVLKELDRVWYALEISGVLTTQLVRKLEQLEK